MCRRFRLLPSHLDLPRGRDLEYSPWLQVLSYGDGIEVVEPQQLRQHIIRVTRSMAKRYSLDSKAQKLPPGSFLPLGGGT